MPGTIESSPIKLKQLRKNIYELVDKVIAEGKPLKIEHDGVELTLSVNKQGSKLSRLKDRPLIIDGNHDLESETVYKWDQNI